MIKRTKTQKLILGLIIFSLLVCILPPLESKAAPKRDYSLVFDPTYYQTAYPDIAKNLKYNPQKMLDHFITKGANELKRGNASFDIISYKRANPDLRRRFENNHILYYNHYIDTGHKENRAISGVSYIKSPVASYHGIDLSGIYDFNYYNNTYPELGFDKTADDKGSVEHFFEKGFLEGKQGAKNQNGVTLTILMPIISNVNNATTVYNGVDLSSVYDYAYYMYTYPDVAYAVNYNPNAAIKCFVETGMDAGHIAKLGANTADYPALKEAIKNPAPTDPVLKKMHESANKQGSSTDYVIVTDKANKRVAVFNGTKGAYRLIKEFPCVIGANSSPTPSGIYKVGSRGRFFNTGTNGRCWYYTQIKGNYLFHSQIYDRSNTPRNLIDGRMGTAASHGCIRLHLENAKWVYDNLPSGSTIIIY